MSVTNTRSRNAVLTAASGVALMLALVRCTGNEDAEHRNASIDYAGNGRVTCVPAEGERPSHERVVREARLSTEEAVRVCVFASSVRQMQWSAGRASPQVQRQITRAIAVEVDRALRGIVPPDKAPTVRAYLLAEER